LKSPTGKTLRVRGDTFGYLQRSFPMQSEVDATEARLVGREAVKYSADPNSTEGSVAMRRVAGGSYKIETFLTPLSTVARETKHMDPSYIVNGNDIGASFIEYVKPLVGELPKVGSFGELKK
jgi:6-phosphofructokinase